MTVKIAINIEVIFRGLLFNLPRVASLIFDPLSSSKDVLQLLLASYKVVAKQQGYPGELGWEITLEFQDAEGKIILSDNFESRYFSTDKASGSGAHLHFIEGVELSEAELVKLARKGNQVAEHMLRRRSTPQGLWRDYKYEFPPAKLLEDYEWEFPISESQKERIRSLL